RTAMPGLTSSDQDASANLPVTIIKIEKRADPYARIDNRTLRDGRLSWKATGLLAYLLSLPKDWHITLQHLCNAKADRLHATQSALKELERHALRHTIEHYKLRTPDQRRGIRDVPVWFTDRYMRNLLEVNNTSERR